MISKYFKPATLKGLTRLGDILLPQTDEFPSFSQFGGIEHIDDVIVYLPKEDIDSLNAVLSILSVMPDSFLTWLMRAMEDALDKQGAIPSVLRQLNLGLRGILFSCYYSGLGGAGFAGDNPMDILGYRLNRVED